VRKYLAAFGIILMLAGVIVSSACNSSKEHTEQSAVAKGQWEASGYFDKNEKLIIYLSEPTREFFPDTIATINVSVVDPAGNKSVFLIEYKKNVGFVNVTLDSNSSGLIVDENSLETGGITNLSGNYTALVAEQASLLYGETGPTVDLYKEIVERDYPYRGMLPVGVAIIVFGASLSILSAKSSEEPRKKRR
jgi:hypothetical protein